MIFISQRKLLTTALAIRIDSESFILVYLSRGYFIKTCKAGGVSFLLILQNSIRIWQEYSVI